MEEFLKTVAVHYKNKVSNESMGSGSIASLPLSRYLFCFPNRRSGLFFARHLRQAFGGACCVPAITTIGELYGLFSERQVLNRTALLFLLYQTYSHIRQELHEECESFDQFVFWGDMLLSDFDDVDRYLVDADKLFANVRDLKEIEAEFAGFTEEQIAVIQSFWRSFQPEKEYPKDEKHQVFGQTWAILSRLYHELRERLKANNQAYEGMLEREVLEQLNRLRSEIGEEGDLFPNLHYDKVVFVGLTAVSKVDRKFLSLLKVNKRAEFCWDYADPRLQSEKYKATSAAYFTHKNLSDFENELSPQELAQGIVPEEQREVNLYSVASGVGQTSKAQEILLSWINEKDENGVPKPFDPLRTAIVLPDEKLLLPMLYAVPMQDFNVTMGYGLRNTPVHAFVEQLAALQHAWRPSSNTFYYRQVLSVLSHTFTLGLCRNEAKALTQVINKQNLYQVPLDLFSSNEFLRLIFRPVSSAQETLDYLLTLLDRLMQRAAQDINLHDPDENPVEPQLTLDFTESEPLFTDTDYEFLYHYRKTVTELAHEVQRGGLYFEPRTLFMLLSKLIAGVSVPFSGEPLRGLQVMGVLETRSLDFDNVIILSMNEGVFPAKPSQNSFVPMSLRDAFEMPTQRHRDSVFAYHFYRLISRASRLALIYDSRTDGMQTGEESRYVKQLRFLMGHSDLKPKTSTSNIAIFEESTFSVQKTPEILQCLQRCTDHPQDQKQSFLSATALNHYITCPMKFYLSFVRGLYEDDEVSEGVDATLFGDIFHEALCQLYKPYVGAQVGTTDLNKYLLHHGVIREVMAQAFVKVMGFELHDGQSPLDRIEGYNLLILDVLVQYAIETLKHDQKLCPFIYLKGEQKDYINFRVNDQLTVRMKAVYDRLDILPGTDIIRIVDYKTGNSQYGDKLLFPAIEELFKSGGKDTHEVFQVMLYSLLYQDSNHVQPNLYFVRDFTYKQKVETRLALKATRQEPELIVDFEPYRNQFHDHLVRLITEIFDPSVPFVQCEDTKPCGFCPFSNLCKRIS